MNRMSSLRILSKDSFESEAIEKDISQINGVVGVEVNGNNIIYYMNEWASDYDVMVSIMNILSDKYNLDSEPLDINVNEEEKPEEIVDVENVIDESIVENNIEEESQEEKDEVTVKKKDITESRWFKVGELGVAVIFMILGYIFDGVGLGAAKYMFMVSYVFASYEVIFELISKIAKKKIFSEELLMVIASLAAMFMGELSEAAALMLLFNIGELFEDVAIDNSKKAIDALKQSIPKDVNVILDSGEIVSKSIENVEVGSLILVKAGERIPLDGIVEDGNSSLDTKSITGEGVYKDVTVGQEVCGGYFSTNGVLKIRTTKNSKDSTLNKIVEIVDDAQLKKAKSEKFIDKFSKYYTPIILGLALLLAFIPPIFTENYGEGLLDWGMRAVMLLCISCPCALVISVPLAFYTGTGLAAKNGIVVKGSEYIETLSKVETFVFDKTGTLTEGNVKITKIVSTPKFKGKVLELANIADRYSNHPLALAIREKCGEVSESIATKNYIEYPGFGVENTYQGDRILCGNAKLMQKFNISYNENNELGMKLYVAINDEFVGSIVFNDVVKDDAYGAINELYLYDVNNTVMLTGDNKEYAKDIRQKLGMKKSVSELRPDDKVKELENIITENNGKPVAYVGDGINDAPVLMRSDVGIAMGKNGSNIAIDAANIVITDDNIKKVPLILRIAKRTMRIVKENIYVSLIVKLAIFVLSVLGVKSLWIAMGADVGIMILAVLNSIRNRFKI